MEWSEEVFMTVSLLSKVPSLLSITCSLLIVHGVLSSPTKRKLPYHRLMVGLSLGDMVSSVGFFWGAWAIPRGTPLVYGAIGNQQTCSAVGFLIVLGVPLTAMYNVGLAFYYMATVRYNWTNRRIANAESVFHVVAWSICLAFGVTGLCLKLYNPTANWICWMEAKPPGCLDTFRYGKERGNCERGNNAFIFQWAFSLAFGWLSFVIMVVCLISIYLAVLNIEKRRDSYRFQSSTAAQRNVQGDRRKSRRVLEQAVLYGLAFVLSWLFQTISRIQFFFTGKYLPMLSIFGGIFIPMQGFWNFLIYRRGGGGSTNERSTFVRYVCCCLREYHDSGDGGLGNSTSLRDRSTSFFQVGGMRRFNSSRRNFGEEANSRPVVDGGDQPMEDCPVVLEPRRNNNTASTTSSTDKVCHKQVEEQEQFDSEDQEYGE